jgi:predicted peptidase
MKIIIPLIFMVIALSACAPQPTKEPVEPGIYYKELEPGNRLYTILVPKGYTGKKPVPLVLALHYGGHGAHYYGTGILNDMVAPALEELGAIIVAPDCNASDWTQPQSEQDVLDLLDYVEETYNIDQDRTLITGYSMGGMGTWHFAATHPERFKAGVVMAGSPQGDYREIDWELPLYVIHSRQDEVVPIDETLVMVGALQSQGASIRMVVLDGVTHYETYKFIQYLRDAIPWILDTWK